MRDKFSPEILSSGLPAANGTFISSSTEYFIEQSQLILCCISFPTSLLMTPIIYYYYDWLMPNCKTFLHPAVDLCRCSRLLLEIDLKPFMVFYRSYPGELKLLPPCCRIFGKMIILLSRSKNNLFCSPVFSKTSVYAHGSLAELSALSLSRRGRAVN